MLNNRTIYTLGLGLLLSLSLKAQEAIRLKAGYQANKKYISTITSKSDMTMAMDKGENDIGIPGFPMNMSSENNMLLTTETSEKGPDGVIPLVIEYQKFEIVSTVNDQTVSPPMDYLIGTKIYGHSFENGAIVTDSLSSGDMPEQMRQAMESTLGSSLNSMVFPEKLLKVGDQFTIETPFDMPLNQMGQMKMTIQNTYILRSFNEQNAFFDIKSELDVDGELQQGQLKMKGSGDGSGVFDRSHGFMIEVDQDMDMSMTMDTNGMTMKISSNTNGLTKTEIANL